jgi:serpin B
MKTMFCHVLNEAWSRAAALLFKTLLLGGIFAGSGVVLGADAQADLRQQREGNTVFACDLYGKLRAAQPGANLFLSPYSVSTALAMTWGGARGNTDQEMGQALHFGLDQTRLHPAFAALQERLNAVQKKGKVQLAVANSIWPNKNYPFLKDYMDLLKSDYGVSVTPVDYANAAEAARRIINLWVEDKTSQKITDLIPTGVLDNLTRLVLVNAIYFKGDWASQFKKADTKDQPFHLASGGDVPAPLMYQSQKNKFRYGESEDLQVLEMPYAGDDLSMVVLLPKKQDGLAELENALTGPNLDKWMRTTRTREVKVWLPRFKMTCEARLDTLLQALGMKDAFNARTADFSGMDGTRFLYLSAVLHKAFVDVNEEGTEAAAATAVVVKTRSARIEDPPAVFRADHPFVFLIRERSTGSLLFLGRLANPK